MAADGHGRFGYIAHSTINVGDDFQSIAAKQFLPADAIPVDREFISAFTHPSKLSVVVSGWFMHERGGYWDLATPPPERSWPPSPLVEPFFISLHLTKTFHSTVFSEANIDYLRTHAPIGARDLFTLGALQERGISSYLSGCLTLTLPSEPVARREVIYLVDLDEPSIQYIRSRTKTPVSVLTHGRPVLQRLKPHHRLQYADYVLGLYRCAKCVVTTRLHAALPCLAFGTPVLLLSSDLKGGSNPRFEGLVEHTWHGAREELMHNALEYDFDDPPSNPTTYLPMRENLARRMQEWRARVRTHGGGVAHGQS